MSFLQEIGMRIKTLRQQCGLSQDDLAHLAGYTSRSSINKVEKGLVDLPQSKISLIASALGVSPTYILYGDKNPQQNNTPEEPKLTEGEQLLLDLFRQVPEDQQQLVLGMIRAALNTKG